ncbi:MAG: acyl carrier protein [Armatimonadetes bacterium]|nr:acyl carrier protein [Armatimonadota bacterium]
MSTETADRIRTVFARVFAKKKLTAPTIAADTVLDSSLQLDSLDFAEIVVRLEAEFGIDPFADGIPPNVRTFGDLVRLYAQVG